ncbi:hypothetical protein [Priestia aryabhattai]|uniref:hypothetical protein n=1 Tax=Priestia aryabhattai TaxID=412384 RepID=UPI00064E4F21|nr:hypothetical protein [Priestia aryabhattai]KML31921.1 hypothetical protein VL11_01760 [Priestia aryabhattai]KMN95098.1 hypothetical protein ABV89_24325 [Priestia aryabhattai]
MFNDWKEEIQAHLIEEGYGVKEFLGESRSWYYFRVNSVWIGDHIVKVQNGFLGYLKERVSG